MRRRAHDTWTSNGENLGRRIDRDLEKLDVAKTQLEQIERRTGRPATDLLDALQQRAQAVTVSRNDAAASERTLARSGVAGLGEGRAVKMLGRRDDLRVPGDLRRYDELAGRIAVADVTSRQDDTPGRWVSITALAERDVAQWRADRGLALDPAQQLTIERQTPDRGPSRGPDLGR